MSEYCVVVTDQAGARIFTLEPAEIPELESGPNLVERHTIVNPQQMASEAEVWTDTRRGAGTEHISGQRAGQETNVPHHNYDEHREDNLAQHTKAFAKDLVGELDRMVSGNHFRRLVLCADKQMLGYLRPELKGHFHDVDLREVPKELAGFNAQQLHAKLASDGHLPQRKERPAN